VEELFLRPLLLGQELDVVDQKDVDRPVALPESGHPLEPDRRDQVVHEVLGGQVDDARSGGGSAETVADRVQQMGLAQAHTAVEEERVVGDPGLLRHGLGGSAGEAVRVADHERAEAVLRVQGAAGCRVVFDRRRRLPRRTRRPGGSPDRIAGLEENLEGRPLEIGDRPVDDGPEAFLQRRDEAGVRCLEDQLFGILRGDPERMEPGAELIRRQVGTQLPA